MALPRIRVSDNGRFLVTEDGAPFFWLADTAWELFHRLTLAEAELYLETRCRQGFTVIQAVILPESDSLRTPNRNGRIPLCGDDPARPNELYFRDVDAVVRLAAGKGLYVALAPAWGDKVYAGEWGVGPLVFDEANARVYGAYLGTRYRDATNLLWILGGDRPADGCEGVWRAMAAGLIEGLGRVPVISYHPPGGHGSSEWFHDDDWLGLNMWQSGHVLFDTPIWESISADYARAPARPVLDAEPNYEDHPVDPFLRKWRPPCGRYTDYDVRKQAYRAVFAGACGHTYGHHSVWQFWALDREPINFPMPTWDEAILRPGAAQMVHLKNLLLSRPYLSRVPAQELLLDVTPPPPVGDLAADRFSPARAAHPRATRCAEGRYAFVYFPLAAQTLRVDLSALRGPVHAWWYDPRTGAAHNAGAHPAAAVDFTSPIAGPDWVLVLDAAGQPFLPPGQVD